MDWDHKKYIHGYRTSRHQFIDQTNILYSQEVFIGKLASQAKALHGFTFKKSKFRNASTLAISIIIGKFSVDMTIKSSNDVYDIITSIHQPENMGAHLDAHCQER